MGDEQKVSEIYKEIDDIYNTIAKSDLNIKTKNYINEKYNKINKFYKEFIDNYLDFREISDSLYDGI
ncbi:MAG: hypothetical protein K0R07_189 [Sedimentibacter sp.]|jgi:hypothetical protein|nr:hypothetical protein [Sedimentibacter sp.]